MRSLFGKLASLALMLAVATAALAEVPSVLTYQGRLSTAEGEPVPNGQYDIVFTIFDAPENGTQIWSESHGSVLVENGVFQVVLGDIAALENEEFSGPDRYLEITLNGEKLSPRFQFTTVAYSHRIGTVDGAEGGEVSGTLAVVPDGGDELFGRAASTSRIEMSVITAGSVIRMLEPVDSKSTVSGGRSLIEISVNEFGSPTIKLFDPVDSRSSLAPPAPGYGLYTPVDSHGYLALSDAQPRVEIGVDQFGEPSISLYEPVDSRRNPFSSGKKIEMRQDGIYMYGDSEEDTNLVIAPSGDITGVGQITMGMNSSSGMETTVLGFENSAEGDSSAIGGGSANTTTGTISVISGGHGNTANGEGSSIGGGAFNTVDGAYGAIGGGFQNSAAGDFATIPGGDDNTADGVNSFAAGHRAKALHDGSFVWADLTDEEFASTGDDQFIVRAGGGVGINTSNPVGVFDVAGAPGDESVNLPEGSIGALELLDEPGISSSRTPDSIQLVQKSAEVELMTSTTITIPAAGYIVLRGSATLMTHKSESVNQAYLQIDDTPGGGLAAPFYAVAGAGDTPGRTYYYDMSTERIFQLPAGTYTFYLEALASPVNGTKAKTVILRPYLTAMFFPTALGTVTTSSGL